MKMLLVIPACDEEPTLPVLIESAKKYIPDVMVVDDGSDDATTLVAALAGAMVHRLKTNSGKGEALKIGFAYAIEQQYDWIFTMDGDGQHHPPDLEQFLPLLDRFDLIIGTRVQQPDRLPFLQRMRNRIFSVLVTFVCLRRLSDSQCGFRAYRTELLHAMDLRCSRFDLETEALIQASRNKARIAEVHVQTLYAGQISRFKLFKDSMRFLRVLVVGSFRSTNVPHA